MIDRMMDKANVNKMTAHIGSLLNGLSAFPFNELPTKIEAQTVDYLVSYIAYKMV
ncbi:hypothetical protein [Kurthia populi]|uniref:hypothetical protein n=1 Tax=Kurthia populi TaxID=1562132 RepID=UPI0036D28236